MYSLRRLFRDVKDICPQLGDFYLKHASVIGNIESAYIVSRYYPIWFEEVEVKEMLETFEEFQEVLRQCLQWIYRRK